MAAAYRPRVAYTLRFVIPDGRSSVLLVEEGSGWALPRVPSDEPEIFVDVAPALRDLVQADVFVLRDVRLGPVPAEGDSIVYLTEPVRDPGAARGRWWTQADLPTLDLVDANDRVALETWFGGEEPESLQSWQREGWFASAVEWIHEVLPDVSEVRQFASWCNSCILRITSAGGRVWFKAVHPHWAGEPAVTAMLADLLPGRSPEVLAIERERGWMLLGDLDGEPVDLLPGDERLEALGTIVEIHRAASPITDALLRGGCRDRRPDVLSQDIEALAADEAIPLPGDLRERLRTAVPRLQELSLRLQAAPLPRTLVHGDLHGGNIIRTDGRFVLFDWSDACVADPFVDVLMFLTKLPDDAQLRTSFRDRYLDAWPDLTRSDAAAYAELAEPLAAMHHAVTYREIHHAFSPYDRALFEGALPRWIEHALACPIVAR